MAEGGGAALGGGRLLQLARWLSPAFPTGSFAWSHGLETAAREGTVRDADTLEDWLAGLIRWGAGRSDAILLGAAHRAEGAVIGELSDLALALAPSRERRAEAREQGAAFARTVRAIHGWDLPDLALPVALGRAARLGDLPAEPVAAVALQAFVTTLVQAVQRLLPLGQTAAQGVVLRLAPLCVIVAEEAVPLGPEGLGSCAVSLDLASMRHETLQPRIFRS